MSIPYIGNFRVETALVNSSSLRSGGSYTLLFTAGPAGSKIDEIYLQPAGAAGTNVAAKMVRIYLRSGSSYFLLKEQMLPSITSISSSNNWGYTVYIPFDDGIVLGANQELYCGISTYTTAGDALYVIAEGKDF